MSLWSKLFRTVAPSSASASGASESALPATVELVPGKLTARVVSHNLPVGSDTVPCWTYVSEGLARLGQDELVFTLRRRGAEAEGAFPPDPLMFFRQVHSLAEQGQIVGPWAYTVFDSPR